ncbi:molybdate-dependent transcriptional regulator [Sulfurimonas gotlandica GD1]|uniref:Molybdate-dependent transcriptional regulator n=1 Tax=Sulfurimonas gotlandica (strain DSM 19862 / JCM 16533 / GD1) TaxID=929558 RepID=B6BI33_SULGG|nr:TOBE domain-containing protein [Sulfurimonas gotlandica]EDZ63396.1 molybdenum-pterin-binding protein [Sulfurimonas gotlandica GD1]EHP30186.1 molybdate-dependent transcriptional regulator [Sulfurimonas gotlandica GD1]
MEIEGRIWFKKEGKNLLGNGRVELLEKIDEYGSISKASRAMKMSYKAAWDMVDAMNNISDKPLVQKVTGGKNGGGAQVTKVGKELINTFKKFKEFYNALLLEVDENELNSDNHLSLIRKLHMKSSSRNMITGHIKEFNTAEYNTKIEIGISEESSLYAIIPTATFIDMDLKQGDKVFALIQESSIMLSTHELHGISARNIIKSTISALKTDAVSTEVKLSIGKNTLTSAISNESLKSLNLQIGQEIYAIIKATDIIVSI